LDKALERLEQVKRATGRVLYISLTHNGENRFGGGNQTTIGLKGDGAALLDYLDCQNVAVDLSHASDALAHGILDHIEARDLSVPVVASHSNFRGVFHHARNLPDELARAVIDRNGLIGINFVRAFLHPEDPSFLAKHILYGLKIGAKNALCFGSDYFHWKGHPDQSRAPFFFQAHADAGKYQSILRSLADELGLEQSRALAFGNAMQFLHRIWKV
jgi:microsomal dipeptidase-like Zn-dependent dipeptidase